MFKKMSLDHQELRLSSKLSDSELNHSSTNVNNGQLQQQTLTTDETYLFDDDYLQNDADDFMKDLLAQTRLEAIHSVIEDLRGGPQPQEEESNSYQKVKGKLKNQALLIRKLERMRDEGLAEMSSQFMNTFDERC
ncbi:hypothetical protein FGO68_gene5343 [Halteria grandinella]|uniref:Uncharacterized protein n=1 Tax=Halteria grandinella TaxID=5974 RepID=A0A8J8NIA2_HALGN|nr:hypothetical protein FGO68_gene5343 [Halteria grandinella]